AKLQGEGIDAAYIPIDLQKPETIQAAADMIASQHPDLSMLINNAAIPGDMHKPGFEFSVDELRDVFETNVFGTYEITRLLLPTLEKNNGRIVSITIPIGMVEYFNPFAYKASKASLNTMTQTLARNFEQAGRSLEIFGIMPGGIATDLNNYEKGPHMKTLQEGGELITGIILDGKHHNGEIINANGALADYNHGLFY
ncbi:MAG: SDR family oxidoreductase, partial [Eggerthellaceae bacterium]|nr:SDR family oxidoreductase [Eggerthellaceae bacterium]